MAKQSGFVPLRRLGGGSSIIKTYPVSASSNDAYFLGDFVIPKTSGKVSLLKAGSPLAVRPLGAIVGFLNSNFRPLTFNQPNSGAYLATAITGYAQICIATKDQTYAAEYSGTINDAVVFSGCKVSAGTGNTATGLSGQTLDGTVDTSSDAQFQVIGVAPEVLVTYPRSGVATSAPTTIAEVVVINPAFGSYIV